MSEYEVVMGFGSIVGCMSCGQGGLEDMCL